MSDDEPAAPAASDQMGADGDGNVVRYLYWASLAALALLAVVALLQFYLSVSRAVSIWVTREYRPLFQAAFNLVVLLVAGVGISLVVRQLRRAPQR